MARTPSGRNLAVGLLRRSAGRSEDDVINVIVHAIATDVV